MEPKPAPILQPCTQTSLEIGQAINAIEAVGRMPAWDQQASCLKNLELYLGQLQNTYRTNCSGTGVKQTPKG